MGHSTPFGSALRTSRSASALLATCFVMAALAIFSPKAGAAPSNAVSSPARASGSMPARKAVNRRVDLAFIPGAIPASMGHPGKLIFDYTALQRYRIPRSAPPPGSVIENRRYSAWELYRPQLIVIAAGFLVLFLMVMFLIVMVRRLTTARLGLRRFNANLESLVDERTASLSRAARGLEVEIAERKRVEEALRESEQRSRLAQEAAESGTWEWNLLTNENRWSRELWHLYGLEPGSVDPTYEAWLRTVHPDDRAGTERKVQHAVSQGVELNAEWRVIGCHGEVRWLMSRGKAFRDAGGRVTRYAGAVIDITERKKTEQELAERESRLTALFDHAGYAISLIKNGVIMAGNPSYAALFGYGNADELVGSVVTHTVAPEERSRIAQYAAVRARGGDAPTRYETRGLRKDGSTFDVEVMVSSYVHDGETYSVAFHRDISERKRAEEEKARLEGQLRQAQKMESVGRLAGGVAHDFNNMLGVIIGHADMALEGVDSAQPLAEDLREIRKAAARSAELTRQLLAFARKQTVAPKVLNLNETVGGMIGMLTRLIGEDVRLTWRPQAGLWPIKVDPAQIDQILANLCVNARDAIADVGTISIETRNRVFNDATCDGHPGVLPGEYVTLVVSDDGCGMDETTLSRIFEPFFTTRGVGKGTGLGLASVYGAVKQNNGMISVISEKGRGTTFTICLPRHAEDSEQARGGGATRPARGRETILLVEDEAAILTMTAKMLEGQGYVVLAAGTPVDAIRIAREHAGPIHLVMTDVVMPGMNGRDLARTLLSIHPRMKRLFTSGYTADVIADHGVLDDGVHFLAKPFSISGLAAKVREVVESR
jgi:two-component system, cell cycle sensor histidine kinase and response regulator CckA